MQQLAQVSLLPNPSCDSAEALELYHFLGQLLGACVRNKKEKLAVDLQPLVWRSLTGQPITWEQMAILEPELDRHLQTIEAAQEVNGHVYSEEEFDLTFEHLDFTTSFAGARPYRQVPLKPGGQAVQLSYRNRHEFVRLVKKHHLHKVDKQLAAMRRGLLCFVPPDVLALWNGCDLEAAAAGEPSIDVDKLKAEASVSLSPALGDMFWQCVTAMTMQQRSQLLRFATGRARLPVGRFYVKEGGSGDGKLPNAATCSFEMYVPRYTSQEVMLRQLLIAVETEDFGTS
eukprot:Tamp_24908.p1 GENE.Tamp_24908~~Tamp_24908.p1  ORF type:complete len:308 (+),score=87.49 Tamp_24908:69-926(+)